MIHMIAVNRDKKENAVRNMINSYIDEKEEADELNNDDADAQTDREVQTEHWNSERLSE